MSVEVSEIISASREAVWQAVTDIEGAAERVSAIRKIEILEQPESGWVGLKWRETRVMLGKEAVETMWITSAEALTGYETRAENCGCIYQTVIRLEDAGDDRTKLTQTFSATPQTLTAKILSRLFFFMNNAIKKAIQQDLQDIKVWLEK